MRVTKERVSIKGGRNWEISYEIETEPGVFCIVRLPVRGCPHPLEVIARRLEAMTQLEFRYKYFEGLGFEI
jgi:hypothetical protein